MAPHGRGRARSARTVAATTAAALVRRHRGHAGRLVLPVRRHVAGVGVEQRVVVRRRVVVLHRHLHLHVHLHAQPAAAATTTLYTPALVESNQNRTMGYRAGLMGSSCAAGFDRCWRSLGRH